jgi:hypothetical protein
MPSVSVCNRDSPRPWVVPEVIERRHSAIVTMTLHRPERTDEGRCLKMRLIPTKRVKLRRPLRDLVLYDGSSSPPRRRALPWEGPQR